MNSFRPVKKINSISRPGSHDHEAWKVIAAQAHTSLKAKLHTKASRFHVIYVSGTPGHGYMLGGLCISELASKCTLSLEDWPCGFSTLPPGVNTVPAMASEPYILNSPKHCHQPTLSRPPPRWWLDTLSLKSPCSLQDRPGPPGGFLPLVPDPGVWTQRRMWERECGRPKARTPSSLCGGAWGTFLSTCIFPSPKAKPVCLPATCPGNSSVSRTLSSPPSPPPSSFPLRQIPL